MIKVIKIITEYKCPATKKMVGMAYCESFGQGQGCIHSNSCIPYKLNKKEADNETKNKLQGKREEPQDNGLHKKEETERVC